jgi:toxin ParE1/3/4
MAARLSWSPDALADLDSLSDFIAADSTVYARSVVRRIIEATHHLADFPESGRVVPEFHDPSMREIFAFSYRILYQIRGTDDIMIVNIIHGRRSLER